MLSSLENRGQKFRHAFCHRAPSRHICVKAELTFDPYSLMRDIIFTSTENLKFQTRSV